MQTVRTVRPAALSLPEPGSLFLRVTRMPVARQRCIEFLLLAIIVSVLPWAIILQATR